MSDALRYGDGELAVPEGHPFRLDRPSPPSPPARAMDPAAIDAALDDPIGTRPVGDALRGARRVVVAVSDASRSTGAATVLPGLVERMGAAGVADVVFAVGNGLHRRPSEDEIRTILGPDLAARHDVVVHDADDATRLVEVGRTSAGTVVRVHRVVADADAVVLTGAVGFHYYAGFSGGRKAIVPGLAARETIVGNHLRAIRKDGTRHPAATAGRLSGNPVHRDMAEAAACIGPRFLVNTVMAEGGGIEAIYAGHWRRAHEAACRHVRRTRTVRLERRPLVVVSAGGAPFDIDLVQAHKAFEAAFGAVAPGGTVILAARCPDGLGPADFATGLAFDDEREHVAGLLRDYRVYVQTALAWRRKLAGCRLVLVSSLDERTVRGAGAEPAHDLDEAFAIAAERLPSGTAGWILPHGVKWLLRGTTT